MKTKITLFSLAIAAIFSSCSKETYFTNTNQSYGGFHKTEQVTTAETQASAEEVTLTASADAQPVIINQTPSFTAPKTVETKAAVAELGLEKVSAMSKKEVKSVIKAAKKEAKEAKKDVSAEGKSQLVALILAILVGALGIHRFYLGYTGIGVAQLLTLGGCGIWALIDLVRIITGDLKPKDGDYTDKL
ncbi:TM2 domain-containing protein [Adhaeribacter sp. BT258]|uniref:TM2 domain-containing protein n=1 Tax=Adhaeribacter terrigena TaxID=2793070 RepID=A0ABS1C6E6_9BACT|nr:TM2 domain-containing protein [Adhaeribacter terrigena]MBK0404942.1 TM2 domain-containing protein [Adhaeribacter terrigena]